MQGQTSSILSWSCGVPFGKAAAAARWWSASGGGALGAQQDREPPGHLPLSPLKTRSHPTGSSLGKAGWPLRSPPTRRGRLGLRVRQARGGGGGGSSQRLPALEAACPVSSLPEDAGLGTTPLAIFPRLQPHNKEKPVGMLPHRPFPAKRPRLRLPFGPLDPAPPGRRDGSGAAYRSQEPLERRSTAAESGGESGRMPAPAQSRASFPPPAGLHSFKPRASRRPSPRSPPRPRLEPGPEKASLGSRPETAGS